MPEDHQEWLGAAALAAVGALPTEETAELERHLDKCPACRTELEELHVVAAAIRNADLDMSSNDIEVPPPGLGERAVWAVRRARRSERLRRRVTISVAAAAAGLVLFAGGMVIPDTSGAPQESLTLSAAPGVDADAALVAHTWGTEVKLVVSGLAAGERYDVAFLDHGGREVSAGTFLGVDDRPIVCDMNAALLREQASRMEVAASDGDVVITADLPKP